MDVRREVVRADVEEGVVDGRREGFKERFHGGRWIAELRDEEGDVEVGVVVDETLRELDVGDDVA